MLATKQASTESKVQATKEEIDQSETEPKTDNTVSGDETWMKRGPTSLHGVCMIIGVNLKRFLREMLSSFCNGCRSKKGTKSGPEYEKWLDEHKKSNNCKRNHFGLAGNMEVEGIKIFLVVPRNFGVFGILNT